MVKIFAKMWRELGVSRKSDLWKECSATETAGVEAPLWGGALGLVAGS